MAELPPERIRKRGIAHDRLARLLMPTPDLGLEALVPERPRLPVDVTEGIYVAV